VIKCKDCSFWNRNGEGLNCGEPIEGEYDYDRMYRKTEHRRCLKVLHNSHYPGSPPRDPTELALVTDGSGYTASLWTLPDFGCALGAPK